MDSLLCDNKVSAFPLRKPQQTIETNFPSITNTKPSISINQEVNNVIILLEKCKKAYFDHCLDEAYKLIIACEKAQEEAKGESQLLIRSILDKEKKLFEIIKAEHNYMQKVLKELGTTDGWVAESVGSDAKFFYKYIPNSDMVSIKLDIVADVPMQNMLTLINEIDLWNFWVPFVKKTYQMKRIHKTAAVYYLELGFPYPLSDRKVHLYGYGVNRLKENGSVLILAESVDNNKDFIARNEIKKIENSATIDMDIQLSGYEIIPLGPNRTRILGVCNMNPKFSWLPASLLNFVLKKGMQFTSDRLVKKAKNLKGSLWEKEIAKEEKKPFYEWVAHIVKDYNQMLAHPRPALCLNAIFELYINYVVFE